MLAELAAANAAFAVIKQVVQNGGELFQAGQKMFEYFDAKATIQKKANERVAGSRQTTAGEDWEEFQALEQLKAQEEHLRETMIYAGRPGLWDDWVKFQAEAARKRRAAQEAAEAERKRRAQQQQEIITACLVAGAAILLTGLILFGIFGFIR